MTERFAREVNLLRRIYAGVEPSDDGAYVQVRNIALPPGWNRSSADVLIAVPPGYPVTPPDNFFVPVGLRLANGQMPSNYSEGTIMLNQEWGQFSFHSQEWQPTPEESHGDNLLTFLALVERRLSEVN